MTFLPASSMYYEQSVIKGVLYLYLNIKKKKIDLEPWWEGFEVFFSLLFWFVSFFLFTEIRIKSLGYKKQ